MCVVVCLDYSQIVANVAPDDTDTWIKIQNDIVNKEREEKEKQHRENARRLV